MDEGEHKICENCKREIPAVNFTIHTVHCIRNIRVCPVCKEPIPQSELKEHHEKLHKLLPCKECGESVCGTDMEDHIRDSCAHTMKACKNQEGRSTIKQPDSCSTTQKSTPPTETFCALELRRGSMPAHERYCGARTENCAECGEWVMHKYRQLHLDSNHGFIRLDDDPVPNDKTTNVAKLLNQTSNDRIKKYEVPNGVTKNLNNISPSTSRVTNGPSSLGSIVSQASSTVYQPKNGLDPGPSSSQSGAIPRTKRTNDQPQVNSVVAAPDKVKKELWASRGALKKRPAPKPPTKVPEDPARDLPLKSALERQQDEEKQRQEKTAYNLTVGLPPVLSPAAKLEKLRKMDALQNPPVNDQEYKNRLQGRVWMSQNIPVGNVLGTSNSERQDLEVSRRISRSKSKSPCRSDLKNLKPMSPEEFMDRFNEMQVRKEPVEQVGGDRFNEIKCSLRALRRGLNEVIAPYNSNANYDSNQNPRNHRSPVDGDEVTIPCEFCGVLMPLEDLVQHETGCRPDLAQYKPPPERKTHPAPNRAPGDPIIIPCEFCSKPQPVYMLCEHQEKCRDAVLLSPD